MFLQCREKVILLRTGDLSRSASDRVSESLGHDVHVVLPLVVALVSDCFDEFLDPASQVLLVLDFGQTVQNGAVDHT